MKKIIYLFVILLMISSCKKESKEKNNIAKNVIEKINNYKPDYKNIDGMIINFSKQKKAYKESIVHYNNTGEKSFVLIDNIPADAAKCMMEIFLNFERGHIKDSTLGFDNSQNMNFAIVVENITPDGELLLNGNDLMAKYATIDSFITKNAPEEALKYTGITLTDIKNGMAYFTCEKVTGIYKNTILSNEGFPVNQPPVLAVDPYTCDGYASLPGYQLINNRLFTYDNGAFYCENGGDLVFWGFSNWTATFGEDQCNIPGLGTGTFGSLGLIWDLKNENAYPPECLYRDDLIHYLNTTKLVYQYVVAGDVSSNIAVIGWQLGAYMQNAMGTYEVAMPILQKTAFFYCTDMPR